MGNKKGKKRTGRVVSQRLLLVLIALVLGITIYAANARRVVGERFPMPFGCGISVVLSGSMEPTLAVNDLVIVRRAESYGEGDIVVYEGEDGFVIHRIIAAEGGTVTTQGDANNVADEPFAESLIKGVMVCRIPGVGALVRAIGTPVGVIVILTLAVVLLILSYGKDRAESEAELDAIRAEIERLRVENKDENEGHTKE